MEMELDRAETSVITTTDALDDIAYRVILFIEDGAKIQCQIKQSRIFGVLSVVEFQKNMTVVGCRVAEVAVGKDQAHRVDFFLV
ncbi:hypothetical protein D3C72_1990950 [compost metagenome]